MTVRCELGRTRFGACILLLVSLLTSVMLAGYSTAPPGGTWRERALEYADVQHMFGPLQMLGQSYTGSFVRFQFDQASVAMSDYTVMARSVSTAVFQRVAPEVPAVGSSNLNGTLFEFSSAALSIVVFNNPTSGLVVRPISAAMNMTFTLASGVDASRNGQSLNLSTPDFSGRLAVTGAATLSLLGFQATAHLSPGTVAFFRTDAVDGVSAVGSTGQTALADAAIGGSLGMESFSIGFEGYVESSNVQYGGISLLGFNLTGNGFEADIQVGQTPYEILALHVHESVIAVDSQSAYKVELDGTELQMMAGINEVMADSGASPKFAMVNGENGTLILMRLPVSGNHIFSIQRILPPPVEQGLNPIQLLAIAAIAIVLLGAATTFMLRKKPA